jgi:hypothetical protein
MDAMAAQAGKEYGNHSETEQTYISTYTKLIT